MFFKLYGMVGLCLGVVVVYLDCLCELVSFGDNLLLVIVLVVGLVSLCDLDLIV